MKSLRKGFTIVELVIVIAVIAILAGVLIPTFSGVVSRAQESAALTTARNSLQNLLSMSSNAQLAGKKSTGKYQTVIVVDGYAYGYTGNQLESINYPGYNPTTKDYDNASSTLYYNGGDAQDSFNTVIVAAEHVTSTTTTGENPTTVYTLAGTVLETIKNCSSLDVAPTVSYDETAQNYTLTFGTETNAPKVKLYVHSELPKNLVCFTTFGA